MPEVVGWRATEGPADYEGIINEFLKALDDEIAVIKETGGDQRYVLKNGELIINSGEHSIYRFSVDSEVYLDDDSPVDVVVGNEKSEGYIVSSNEESIDVAIKGDLGPNITQALVISNTSKILEALQSRYQEILSGLKFYNKSGCMKLFGFQEPKNDGVPLTHCLLADLNAQQRLGVDKSLIQETTFIWGPPGTGKTRTLSVILNNLIKDNKSVLLTSHTNLAVDEALKKFAEDPQNKNIIDDGKVIRYGTITNPDPHLKNFLIDNIVVRKSKPLRVEADSIKEKITKLEEKINVFNTIVISPEYKEISMCREELQKNTEYKGELIRELQSIRNQIMGCEGEISRQESIIKNSSKGIMNFIGYLFSDANPQKLSQSKLDLEKLTENESVINGNIAEIEMRNAELTKAIIDVKKRVHRSTKLDAVDEIDDAYHKINGLNEKLDVLKSDLAEIETKISKLREQIFNEALVIGCTLTKSYMDQKIFNRRFDKMILDEASMANLPSVFFVSGLSDHHIISGDFRQLAPIAKSDSSLAEKWLKRDIFLQSGIIKSIDKSIDDDRIIMLKEQYRMHPDIASLINYKMYKGQLKTSLQTKEEKIKITCLSPFENNALVLCDTSTINPWCSRTQSNSRINLYSAMLSVKIAEKALDGGVKSIGIVTPYRAQAKIIEDLLEERKIPKKMVHASTIHKFQGNQKEYIIIDLVEGGLQSDNVGRLLREYAVDSNTSRLINVAASRAQGKLIIIANNQYFTSHLRPGNLIFDVLEQIKEKGLTVDSNEILLSYYGITPSKVTGGKKVVEQDDMLIQYNETSFYKVFNDDVKNASSRIVIFSPFITKNRMRKLFSYLGDAADRGVGVYLIIRHPRADTKDYDEVCELIEEIRKANINVITASEQFGMNEEFHEKFAIIDRRVLYYGSLNILSQSTTSETMLAFTNKKSIEDMIKNFNVDNITRKYNAANKRDKKILKPIEPDDSNKEMANAQYTAGVIQIKLKNYPEAIKYLRSAIKINPKAAAYYHHLGIALCKDGQKTEAVTQLQKSVALSPDNITYRDTLRIAQNGI